MSSGKHIRKKSGWKQPLLFAVILIFILLVGALVAKYTTFFEKTFGISFSPSEKSYVLEDGSSLNEDINEETEHVVFGKIEDYSHVVSSLNGTLVGESEEHKIYLYYDETTKTTYILSDKIINFNGDSSDMFAGRANLLSITYDNIDTMNVTDMSGMYHGCSGLTELDLTKFSTPKVTDMATMFHGCSGLVTVYTKTTYVTSKVTLSENMFEGCYNLVGGEGTAVYPGDAAETTMPLDKTHARIDGLDGEAGYFTDKLNVNAYFRSNILRDSQQNATYTVYGKEGWLTIANGLDSKTYAADEIEYQVTYYIQNGEEWVQYETAKYTFEGDKYSVDKFELKPIGKEGNVYNTVKVVATNLSGLEETIEAVISFEYTGYEASYRYENGIIYITVVTNDDGGKYEADIKAGISPDNSDPNKVFTTAKVGPTTCEISLKKHTEYEFCFFVTDAEVINELKAESSKVSEYVEIKKN